MNTHCLGGVSKMRGLPTNHVLKNQRCFSKWNVSWRPVFIEDEMILWYCVPGKLKDPQEHPKAILVAFKPWAVFLSSTPRIAKEHKQICDFEKLQVETMANWFLLHSHRIHVWYVYLRLPWTSTKSRWMNQSHGSYGISWGMFRHALRTQLVWCGWTDTVPLAAIFVGHFASFKTLPALRLMVGCEDVSQAAVSKLVCYFSRFLWCRHIMIQIINLFT